MTASGASRAFLAGLLALQVACGGARGSGAETDAARPDENPVVVHVTNQFTLQMNVYAEAGGSNYRMGLVEPGITRRFALRAGMVGNGMVEFWAQPSAGGQVVRTGRLMLSPGAVVDFEIAAQPGFSRATVRP